MFLILEKPIRNYKRYYGKSFSPPTPIFLTRSVGLTEWRGWDSGGDQEEERRRGGQSPEVWRPGHTVRREPGNHQPNQNSYLKYPAETRTRDKLYNCFLKKVLQFVSWSSYRYDEIGCALYLFGRYEDILFTISSGQTKNISSYSQQSLRTSTLKPANMERK